MSRTELLQAYRDTEQDLDLAHADLEDALQVVEDLEAGGLQALLHKVTFRAGGAEAAVGEARAALAAAEASHAEAARALVAIEQELARERFVEALDGLPEVLLREAEPELALLAELEAEIAMALNAVEWAERILLAIREDVQKLTTFANPLDTIAHPDQMMGPARRALVRAQEACARIPGDLVDMMGDHIRFLDKGYRKKRTVVEHLTTSRQHIELDDMLRAKELAVDVLQGLQHVRTILGQRQQQNLDTVAALRNRLAD